MNEQTGQIQKTASTLFDLHEHADVAYTQEIADLMVTKTGITWPRISVNDFSAFPVSRFHTNQNILEFFSEKFGSKLQIVELGAGFTPHYLNLKNKVLKYVEVEHESNSNLKKEIIHDITSDTPNLVFVSGDILEAETWEKVKAHLDINYPVIIFSEGVIAQYFDAEQKAKVTDFFKELLVAEGSAFVLDDTLRNHPELHNEPVIKEGMSKIVQKSGSSVYNAEFQTFESEVERWKVLLSDKKVVTIAYVKSKPEMDFATGSFKLIVCMQDTQSMFEKELSVLSEQNAITRVWK